MKKYKLVEINEGHIPEISQLLLHRQKTEYAAFPYFNNTKINAKYITENLREMFSKNNIIGFCAYDNNKLIGYMFGFIKFDIRKENHIFIPYEGCAISKKSDECLIMILYREVSKCFLNYGAFKHYVMLPTHDTRYINAFQSLSFAYEQAYAILDINNYEPFKENSNVSVKIGTKNDRNIISSMYDIIIAYQNDSPVYGAVLPEIASKIKTGFNNIVDEEDATLYLANYENKIVAYQTYYDTAFNITTPDNSIELTIAGTLKQYMGLGIGKSMMNYAINDLRSKGIKYILCDYRVSNISSSRFWSKCGFKVFSHRMFRQIDRRIAWANMDNPLIKKIKSS